jgi:hypothetical protein
MSSAASAAVPLFMLATSLLLAVAHLFIQESQTWTRRTIGELLIVSISASLAYLFWKRATRWHLAIAQRLAKRLPRENRHRAPATFFDML